MESEITSPIVSIVLKSNLSKIAFSNLSILPLKYLEIFLLASFPTPKIPRELIKFASFIFLQNHQYCKFHLYID